MKMMLPHPCVGPVTTEPDWSIDEDTSVDFHLLFKNYLVYHPSCPVVLKENSVLHFTKHKKSN